MSLNAKTFYFPHSVDGAGFSMLFSLIDSPGDINLTGRTTITLGLTLTFPATIPVGTVDRLDLQAIDSRGNRSNVVSVNF